MTQALEFEDAAGGGKRESRGGFVFVVEHFREEHLGAGGEAAAGHLLGIAHQFIKVNFWGGDKSSDAAAALDDSFAFERGQGVAGGHQADLMDLGEVAFGRHGVAGTQVSGIDTLADGALNPLVGRQAVAILDWHSLPRTNPGPPGGHRNGAWFVAGAIFSFTLASPGSAGRFYKDAGCYRAACRGAIGRGADAHIKHNFMLGKRKKGRYS